jgi:hypothetical protein
MSATGAGPLPVVRLRLSCADVRAYREARAEEIVRSGVFVRSDRRRTIGDRVHLVLEVLDGSQAYSGPATVTGLAAQGDAAGYHLALETSAREPGEAVVSAEGLPLVTVSLAEYLFGEGPDAPVEARRGGRPPAPGGSAGGFPRPSAGKPVATGIGRRISVPVARLGSAAEARVPTPLPARPTPPPQPPSPAPIARLRTPAPVRGRPPGPAPLALVDPPAVEEIRLPRPDLTPGQRLALVACGVAAALGLVGVALARLHP